MSISIPQLRGFLALAEHLSFKRAAISLNITQPALSNQVKALEQSLGVRLFLRTTRSVELTVEGVKFFRRARRTLADFDSAVADMRAPASSHRGTVTFACIPTVAGHVFPRIIRQYIKRHPEMTVEMLDDETVTMERKILNREVDFGVGGRPRRGEDFIFAPIIQDPFVLLCRRDHPLAVKKHAGIDDALKYPIISLAKGSNVRETTQAYFVETGRTFSPAFELRHHYTVGAMVEAGLGIAFLPSQATAMIRQSARVKILHLTDTEFVRSVGLITRKADELPSMASHFYAFTVKTMKTMNDIPELTGLRVNTASRNRRGRVSGRP
jgi:DNA-binding transcriptional LysR family regulator